MNNKILLYGYFANNLGDDLFIKVICNRYKNCIFYIIESKPYTDTFLSFTNVKVYPLKNIFDIKFDLQILIGGSLFMQPRDVNKIHTKFEDVKKTRYFNNVPFIIIGANFGPYTDIEHYKLYKRWFLDVDDICFRDIQSYNQFMELPNVRWAPDVIFNYKLETKKNKSKSISISCIYNNQRIGLTNYSQNYYYQKLVDISIYYIENGYEVKIASFCNHQDDSIAAYDILFRMPTNYHKYVKVIEYNGLNLEKFLSEFLDAEYIIGTRFHSIILGWIANIPVFPIIYNAKSYNMIKSYQFNGKYSHIENVGNCSIDFIEYNRKELCIPDCSNLIKQAVKQFNFINLIYFWK